MNWLAYFLVALIAAIACFPIALMQAYLAAFVGNVLVAGRLKTTDDRGPRALFRRYNYAWFIPSLVALLFFEEGRSYTWPDWQIVLGLIAVVSFFVGALRLLKDSVDRRFGPSPQRERRARTWAIVASPLGAITVLLLQIGSAP
ncbi:MAG: hypothetical protein AAFO93_01050 [Pseudomonadota bacterium]